MRSHRLGGATPVSSKGDRRESIDGTDSRQGTEGLDFWDLASPATVVDFVAVKAQAIHKDQQAENGALYLFIPKHLKSTNFNSLQ
jgi:hypothetical protein